jgi:hypothetical protein
VSVVGSKSKPTTGAMPRAFASAEAGQADGLIAGTVALFFRGPR